jgi:vitamin B12 transporter
MNLKRIFPSPVFYMILCLTAAVSTTNWLTAADSPAPAPRTETIIGRMADQAGAVLPRTIIEIHDLEGKLVVRTQSNSRGDFSFDLPHGEYTLTATHAGFASIVDRPLYVTTGTPPVLLALNVTPHRELVVVTATKTETPLTQVGSSVSVITGEELAMTGAFSVADSMRQIAGMSIVQSGGIGQTTSMFLRGGGSNYTKVLVDGIPVNEPGGSFNLANLSTASIDRIEIVRGPQSALYGSDAITGVVQVFTKRGKSRGLSPLPFMMVEGGSLSTLRYGGGIQGSSDRMDYLASFSRFDTDNNVPNGSFNNASIAGNLGLHPSEKLEIRMVYRSEAGRVGTPGPWAFGRPDLDAHYRRHDNAGSVTVSHFQSPSWTQKISYTINDSQQLSDNPLDSGEYTPQFEDRIAPFPFMDFVFQNINNTRRQKVNYQSDLLLPRGHLLTAGGEYERVSGIVGDPSLDPPLVFRNNFSGYIQDQWTISSRMYAAAGVRLDRNESFGFYASPRLSLSLLARQPIEGKTLGTTRIKANFGLGIKEPTLLESFSTSFYYQGNPDLEPEKTVSFDIGGEQLFNSGRGLLEVTWFQSRFRDQIGFEITDFSTFAGSFFNIGKSRARGIETALSYELPVNITIGGTYTFLDSEVQESTSSFDPVYAEGQELLRRPRHSGSIDLRWKPGRWTLGATGLLTGTRVDSDFSSLGITSSRGYSVLNLLANYRLVGDVSVFAALNNATNERYMEVLGYPSLGRNFRVGLRAGF